MSLRTRYFLAADDMTPAIETMIELGHLSLVGIVAFGEQDGELDGELDDEQGDKVVADIPLVASGGNSIAATAKAADDALALWAAIAVCACVILLGLLAWPNIMSLFG